MALPALKTLTMILAGATAPADTTGTYQTPTREPWSVIEKRLDVDDLYGRGYPDTNDPAHLQGAKHGNGREKFKGRGAGLHRGIDINAPNGTPVYPIIDGAIFYEFQEQGAPGNHPHNGNRILYETPNGTCISYMHLSKQDLPTHLKKGDTINKDTMIGRIGTSGNASDPHAHVQFYRSSCKNRTNTNHYDPTPFLRGDHN